MSIIDELVIALRLDKKDFEKGKKEAEAALDQARVSAKETEKAVSESMGAAGKSFSDAGKSAADLSKQVGGISGAAGLKSMAEAASEAAKGQSGVTEALHGTKDAASESGKELESRGKKSADVLRTLKAQALSLLGLFTAGLGIKSFASQIITGDAATGRLAKSVGVSSETLSVWQGVAERFGGTAQGISQSFQGINGDLQQFALTGQSAVVPILRSLGVEATDATGKIKGADQILLEVSDALSKMDPARARAVAQMLPFDTGTIEILLKGRGALEGLLDQQKKIAQVSAADTAASQKMQDALARLSQGATDLGRKLLTDATPMILKAISALERLGNWARGNRGAVETAFYALAAGAVALTAAIALPAAGTILLVTACTAAGAAIAVLAQDWQAWTAGGKSQFGEFWQAVADSFASASAILEPFLSAFKKLFSDQIEIAKASLQMIYAIFTGNADDISKAWEGLTKSFGKYFEDIVDTVKNLGPKMLSAMQSGFGSAFDWAESRAKAISAAIFGGPSEGESSGNIIDKAGAALDKAGSVIQRAGSAIGDVVMPKAEASTLTAKEKLSAAQITDQMVSMGWTREQAAGIAANIHRESSGSATATGDSGKAYGLAQWHPDRQAEFKRVFGKDIRESSAEEQLRFIDYELRHGNEKSAGKELMRAITAEEAARVVSTKYERPADTYGEAQKRAVLAGEIYRTPAASIGAATVQPPQQQITNNAGNTQNTTSIGTIVVNTQATNAQGVASGIKDAFQSNPLISQANRGM